jgi:hypothetical protein
MKEYSARQLKKNAGGTNPITNKTLSADKVIGEILDTMFSYTLQLVHMANLEACFEDS